MKKISFIFIIYTSLFFSIFGELTIYLKNDGNDITKETIFASSDEDTITIKFQTPDGTDIISIIDAKNEFQFFKFSFLPEFEVGNQEINNICFITYYNKEDIISSDAVFKLRQKNANAIRYAEEIMSENWQRFNIWFNESDLFNLVPHISHLCLPKSTIFSHESILQEFLKNKNKSYEDFKINYINYDESNNLKLCAQVEKNISCLCQLRICIGWFPCGLKFCRGKDFNDKLVNYRCGIKTCEKCHHLEYITNLLNCPNFLNT